MSKTIEVPSDGVLILVARATEDGPHVDIMLSQEWWAAAAKDHRKALFEAALTVIGQAGQRVIPEEFGPEAQRDLEPMGFEQLEALSRLAVRWANALDVVHGKTFLIGPELHPELELLRKLERELHDAAMKVKI